MESLSKELPRPRLIHTIRVRLFIITGLLLLLNVCGGLAHLLLEQQQNAVEMSTNMIESDSDTLLSAMIDQETGLRGYITTADPVFLEPFYQGRETYQVTLPQLTQILQDENLKNTHIAFTDFNILAGKWYNSFALIQLRLIHEKNYAEARSVQNARQGKAMFDAFRIGAKDLKNIVNEDTDALRQNTNMLTNSTIITIIVATLLLLIFIWFIIQQIFNDIRKQLKVLSTTMASYNQGDDHIRMESMQHEEFYVFENIFNDMIDRIDLKNQVIEQLELNLRLLTNALPQIVWTANPDGYVDYYNQRWFDYTGMTLEGTQGWGWEPVLHPDDLQICVDTWTHSFTTGETYQLECRFKRAADGMYRWHLVRALPLRDDAGKIIKWFGTTTDIEDLKHAEQMLVQAIQDQHNFVSMVSHEFRTALTSIQGFSELLSVEDFEKEQVKDYAQDIHTDATRLHRMINDLLDLEKMESGRTILEPEEVDFIELISEIVERTKAISTEHQIDFTPSTHFPSIYGDKDKLIQIMYNLLSNAIKYSPQGGHIFIEVNVEKAQIHICVQDQGLGIPKEALGAIFHPYNRVRGEDTRYIKGTGLGLPIVRHLVELHGGRIWAESVPGQGSTFNFTLPIKRTAQLTH
jgi:PAS domain S-box-containing protein